MGQFFKWKQFESEIIMLCTRWYLRYPLSYRHWVEMMNERGLSLSHTMIMKWVHKVGPLLDKMVRPYLKSRSGSWRLDETSIKVKGVWMYLYRAVDRHGNTIDFYFSKTRSGKAAKRFLTKAVRQQKTDDQPLYAMNFDKNPAYPHAF
jgi:IS6 family transposase